MARGWRIRQAGLLLGCGTAMVVIGASSVAGPAFAGGTWTTTMTVEAVGESAVMPAGQSPTAVIVQGAISVTWGPSTFHSGKEVGGYLLNRQAPGSSTIVRVCKVDAPNRVCQDSPPPQQNVMYSVVPIDSSWQGPASAPSAPIMLPDPPATPTAALSPDPGASASPTPTPSATASPTPSTTPTVSPSASATSSTTPAPTPGSTPAPSPS
jgi:hypothetical protein